MHSSALWLRRIVALLIVIVSFWIWTRHSDVIELIVRQRPVLFGRYSQGHFGTLLLLTPILWGIAAAFASRKPLRESLLNTALGTVTTIIAIVAITYLAHFTNRDALYEERKLPDAQANEMHLAGVVRHRPANRVYELTYRDVPEQARSYPNPPPGYPDVPLRLTSDAKGFRNLSILPQYDIVAVGDSFVAGSNVSDDQTWPALLAQATGKTIYNLGVGGSGPPTYMSNFAYFGLDLKPRLALFMIYEGNDFKEDVVLADPTTPTLGERVSKHFERAIDAAPVRIGLKQASRNLFEKLGSTRPVPGYAEKLGFMPIKLQHGDSTHFYSFDPKRLVYLNYSTDKFVASDEWQATAKILTQIVKLCRDHAITPVFIYAPSTPHVVLPLAKETIPAEQLRYFVSLRKSHLPPADEFKQQVFANLDNEQNTVLDFCEKQQVDCLALTEALQQATASGTQTYFSYDQHWTPDGNAVAAKTIEQFLRAKGYLQ